ncbi:MAG: leucine-rich repeat domain-containing protein, partial [Anaeroplasmataceae bacterium]|nr:leucine-rich repeat domain-containing protein [Anaeroplasmataceae bacterium]
MKRYRRIIKFVTAFLLTAVIVCTSILVIRFNKFEKGGNQTPEKIYNYIDVNQSDINFQLAGNGKSYIVKGFSGSTLPALPGSNDKYRLTIPETYDNGTTGPLPVSAIDIATVGSNPDMTSKWFSTVGNPGDQRVRVENIVSVVVPNSVQTISVGAFNSFINVEEMVLPFIGTQRGNNASEDGYLSSMYALFGDSKFMGQVDANFDVQTNDNKTKIEDIIDPNTGAILAPGNGKITWYDTTGTTIDYDSSSDVAVITGTLQRRTAVVVPAHLKSVTITDEYLVANHAFFMMLPLKKVSINFSSDIPVTVEGANSIGERVFDTASNLVEAYLPDAISTLREGVFSFCSRLKTVLPQSKVAAFQNGTLVANSASMSKLLDSGDGQGLVYLPLDGNTNATIPDATFYGCRSIQNMVLSSEIRSIGRYAFGGDSGLRKVLTSLQLPTYDFTSDKNTNILPANVTLVNDYAFRNCSGLKNMTIETSLKTMGAGVFNACSSLESLTIPFIGKERGNGTSIVANAYTDGTQESLFGYIFGELGSENPSYKKVFQATTANPSEERVYAEMQINGGTGSGGASAGVNVSQVNVPFAYFYIPTSLQSVTITNESVIAIGAFMNCSMIENLQIYSFSEDESGLSTTQIGQGALAGCSGLTTLSIPFVGRTDVGMDRNTLYDGRGGKGRQLGHAFGIYSGFSGCPAVTQQEPFTTAAEYYYIPEALKSVELNHQSYVPSYAFWNCSGLETVIIGDKTKGMQRSMFKGCTNLTNLTVPFVGVQRGYSNDNVKWYFWWYDHEIRNSCIWFFSSAYTNGEYYNAYVTDWQHRWDCYIPYSLKNITVTQEYYYETNAFKGFHQVENITIRAIDDYTSMHIDSGIMNGCSNIQQIDIPFIGRDYNKNSESNQAYTIGWLFGTAGYSNSYAATQATGGSTTTFQIPKSLDTILIDRYFTRIADGAFRNMTSLVSVTNSGERAANISYLGSYAFANCYNLQSVEFPRASYTDMGNYAFSNCVSLAKIDEFSPLTVTKIGHHALEGTSVSVVDFSRYSYIGDYAFANCLQLTQVDMAGPDPSLIITPASSYTTAVPNYTYVGNHMFANCVNLTDVTLKPLKKVGGITYTYATPYMFQNCTSLENIVIDNCMDAIPDGLFDGCSKLKDNSQPGQGLVMTASTSSITRIGENAFRGCSTMQTLALPERLQSIGRGAFQRCSNLDSLRIPRECDLIPYGSDFNQTPVFDDYVSGVFYGCNEDKFYLEVYHPEEDWNTVLQWGQNWNCYFPVYI